VIPRRPRPRHVAVALLAALALSGPAAAQGTRGPDREQRLAVLREQIDRLERERAGIAGRERGVLADLDRTRNDLRLCEARLAEIGVRLEDVAEAIAIRTERIDGFEQEQLVRRGYLGARVAQLYREGPSRSARLALGGGDVEGYLASLRYAAWLGERDARVLGDYRDAAGRLTVERSALLEERERLESLRVEDERARTRLDGARVRQTRALAALRSDRTRREEAVRELASAAGALEGLVDSRVDTDSRARPDLAKFRGLIDPPVEGTVIQAFGDVVHPRFKTRVPHPGVDIAAADGTPFRAVFEGRVVYAAWLRGYGLTAIVDHGHGAVSVYAHASALLVEADEEILAGQTLGYVGETGTLEGPRLYFELRRDGRPEDPEPWFRR